MLSILSPDAATNRRELMRIGGLSLLGLSAGQLESLLAANPAGGRAKSCVFLFLFGGPSQIDLWDMKPSAPAEIRGEFKPASTSVPGIQICEHLPRLAEQMDKICLIRSMTHGMNVHGPACSEIFTGRDYFGAPTTDQARDLDWPSMSSLLMRYGRSHNGLPASVVLPWYLQFPGQAKRIAGQTGGRMGERHNALLIEGDSAEKGFRVDGFGLQETVPIGRLNSRRELLQNLSHPVRQALSGPTNVEQFNRHRERAYTLLKGRACELLDLDRETVQTRQRYGETMVGQSLLLARRLIEAGVRFVTIQGYVDTGIYAWDHHWGIFPHLDRQLPIYDNSYAALLNDLDSRGLLETTLVITAGEFGRTPKINANKRGPGRDHWGRCFSVTLGGGGVQLGRVVGSSDKYGAAPAERPVSVPDFVATVYRALGLNAKAEFVAQGRLMTMLPDGSPVHELF
ncbi:MAG: DUF1501 domain-containing protein [Pirellulaceae bacterium]|nr:DUF1501 domain-containing protein [Pirellulaceae bacterium]